MTENPYASSIHKSDRDDAPGSAQAPPRDLSSQLDMVAKITILLCGLWFPMIILGRFLDENAPPIREMLGFYAVLVVAPALGLYGAISTLRRERYPMSVVGATCMAIPLIGPWCGLTFPIGIWSLVLLRRKQVREAFASRAACAPETVEGLEDTMTLAAQMERNGDWDTAIELYGQVASEWPEHATYANNSIDAIRRKQAASE